MGGGNFLSKYLFSSPPYSTYDDEDHHIPKKPKYSSINSLCHKLGLLPRKSKKKKNNSPIIDLDCEKTSEIPDDNNSSSSVEEVDMMDFTHSKEEEEECSPVTVCDLEEEEVHGASSSLLSEQFKTAYHEAFLPLTLEEEDEVSHAFALSDYNRDLVLVTHEDSNIEITAQVFQCLKPLGWLNDEVINFYFQLLKEREKRQPERFLKCHFFNTLFYKRLTTGESGYDFKSVRRWTSPLKIGYNLMECDKLFVPIHKEMHWFLGVINIKDEKFEYLDSLKRRDAEVLDVLARYYVDEVKDKTGKDIDVSSWKREYADDLPAQKNWSDCGMFMIKYIDFYSRGLGLLFDQDDIPYFRKRTAKEILRLRAD